jgi:hypothetical protein
MDDHTMHQQGDGTQRGIRLIGEEDKLEGGMKRLASLLLADVLMTGALWVFWRKEQGWTWGVLGWVCLALWLYWATWVEWRRSRILAQEERRGWRQIPVPTPYTWVHRHYCPVGHQDWDCTQEHECKTRFHLTTGDYWQTCAWHQNKPDLTINCDGTPHVKFTWGSTGGTQ